MTGLEDGIYHFEPQAVALRQLHSLAADEGIEACFREQQRITGIVLLFSAIYYRSSWKYGKRALRYCLLDTGHLLGCVEAAASCMEYPFQIRYQLDHAGLIGQRIYLAATLLNIGCSGIGAFYDQETADFLDTVDMILYAVAVGR